MKLTEGVIYFPRVFVESQCPTCSKVLQWSVTKHGSEAKSKECCGKIFNVFLNYVRVELEEKLKICTT
jgi:hypothetical protein